MKWEGALWVKTLVSNYGFFVVVVFLLLLLLFFFSFFCVYFVWLSVFLWVG